MLPATLTDPVIGRLFEQAVGWNRIAKAARGDHRWRAYAQKKRALERIKELCPGAVRVDSVDLEADDADEVIVGVTVRRHGRLHLRLRIRDHCPRGRWHEVAWARST